MLVDPICKYCHVPVYSRSVCLGTARAPARVPNQPPDPILRSNQRPSTVSLGTEQVTEKKKGTLKDTRGEDTESLDMRKGVALSPLQEAVFTET